MCFAQPKIFVIACFFDIMQLDNMLQIFLIAVIKVTSLQTRIIEPSNHRVFTCSKSANKNTSTSCEICPNITGKTPERHQLTSLGFLYCKLYTHFTVCLVFVLLTLNMQLFAGQLSFFRKDMWEIHRKASMWNCRKK